MEAPSSAKRQIVVIASTEESGALQKLIGDASHGCVCLSVAPKDIPHCQGLLRGAAAAIVAADHPALSELPPSLPIIVCGDTWPERTSSRPSVWVRKPTMTVLRAILHDLLGPSSLTPLPPPAELPQRSLPPSLPPSSGQTWRRKTDMIIGRSVAIRQLLDALNRIASSTAPVSVTGESGTGKELVARALHYSSSRSRAPFIALNCAAIPESLFEAELFGYVRGAFTGAVATRVGAFEGADNGTLFLDEIGEMSKTLQPKLLRVLERGEIKRLGSNDTIKVKVRVVTATNRKLEDEVAAGNFRQDLFYRLRVCHVHIPPLRERLEDIAPLVAHHLAIIAAREQRPMQRLSAAAFEKAMAYSWPGNVRELLNVLEAATLLAKDNVIDADHLQLAGAITTATTGGASSILPYREAKAQFEADYYGKVLRAAHGNVSLAAKLTHKTRKEVYDALRRVGLQVDSYRDDDVAEG